MDHAGLGELVEGVYDLALDTSLWPQLLQRLAEAFGAHAGSLTRENMVTHRGAGFSIGLDVDVPQRYFDYYASRNVIRMVENPRERMRDFTPIVTLDQECLPKSELVESEFYVDFLRPAGIHSMVTIGLWGEDVEFCGVDFYRPNRRPEFEAEDRRLAEALQPHLIRALKLGGKLDGLRELASGLAAGLDRAPFGYFVLDRDGRPAHVNQAAEAMLRAGGGFALLSGRLTAVDAADGKRLQALIAQAGVGRGGRAGGRLTVRRGEGRAPLSVMVAPASAERLQPFLWDGGVVVCASDPEANADLPKERLKTLYGLTDAQSGVALALFEGHSVRETAETLGLSVFTVRAHLAHIFDKTGVSRQSELMALMMRAAGGFGL